MATTTEVAAATAAIRPFTVPTATDAELDGLRARIAATRWPDRELVTDHSQGVQLAVIQEIARYWETEHDWRRCEAKLQTLPHFVTEIDGLDIHFIHVRSHHENALPMIVTHGWPSSVIALLKIIGPLTNPTAHGASAADAFDLVIPSIPGYGYSGRPRDVGWGPDRTARAWAGLMGRIGYTKYVAQGGDWGAIITDVLAAAAPPGLIGMHTNMPGAVPLDLAYSLSTGGPLPYGLLPEEHGAYQQLQRVYSEGIGYAIEMGTQPQTLYGLADSPVGLASWMINYDAHSYGEIAQAFAGHPVGDLTRDEILDNITLYWLTNTIISSARLYWENKFGYFDPKNVTIPAGVSVFPHEIYRAPRSWAEQAYPNLIHFNELDRGGHFPAWQEPALFADEIRTAFRSLR